MSSRILYLAIRPLNLKIIGHLDSSVHFSHGCMVCKEPQSQPVSLLSGLLSLHTASSCPVWQPLVSMAERPEYDFLCSLSPTLYSQFLISAYMGHCLTQIFSASLWCSVEVLIQQLTQVPHVHGVQLSCPYMPFATSPIQRSLCFLNVASLLPEFYLGKLEAPSEYLFVCMLTEEAAWDVSVELKLLHKWKLVLCLGFCLSYLS